MMKLERVKLEYDPQVDAAYLTLFAGKTADSEEIEPGLIVDLDEHRRLLGVEILRFSQRFRAEARRSAARTAG
jgi:uncharacterized protein YuzE